MTALSWSVLDPESGRGQHPPARPEPNEPRVSPRPNEVDVQVHLVQRRSTEVKPQIHLVQRRAELRVKRIAF